MQKFRSVVWVWGALVLALLLGFLVCGAVQATEPPPAQDHAITAVDVTGLADGKYVLVVEKGKASVHPLLLLTPGNLPDPIDPVDPLTARAKAVRDAAVKATGDTSRAKTAGNLSLAYREIAKGCGATFKGYDQIAFTVAWTWDQVTKDSKVPWTPTRTVVLDELAKMAQDGATDVQFATYLGEVADGLNATVPNDGPKEIDWDQIMKLLEFFIKYILPLFVKGGVDPAALGLGG